MLFISDLTLFALSAILVKEGAVEDFDGCWLLGLLPAESTASRAVSIFNQHHVDIAVAVGGKCAGAIDLGTWVFDIREVG